MTPRFRLTCTAILAGMVLPMLVVADAADPRAWLDRMSHSFRELNYSGVFTYEFGQQMSSIRIVHAVVDGVERERIVHLDGPMVEVIRTGHELSCIHVGDSLVRLDHTIPAGPFAKQFGAGLGPIEDHYQVVLAGDTRVAGRDALVLEVRPLDAFRFGYQLAVDKATALLLRSQLLDAQHRILERFQFAELRIGGAPDLDGLEPSTGGQVVAHHLSGKEHEQALSSGSVPAWTVAWLPEGFMVAASELERAPRPDPMLGAQMYTDGLAVFSVFVEHVNGAVAESGSARRGGTVAYTTPMHGRKDRIVTVVGEVPLVTARRVANSVSSEFVAQP